MNRGFTLIEVTILTSVTAVALVALVNLFLMFNSMYSYQRVFIATAGSSGAALNALQASILPADGVLVSHNFSGTTYTSATTTLVLELPTVNSSGNLVSGAKDYVAFYASSTELYRRVEANAQSVRISGLTLLSTTLSSLSFTYGNVDVTQATNIITDIQTQTQFKQQTIQSHLREQLYLRNL